MRTPPATVRIARPDDLQRIASRYPGLEHLILAATDKTMFAADAEGELVGTLTVGPKNSTLVLHGLHVYDGYRRYGFGTQLLRALASWLGDRECYATPDRDLVSFFGQIGFVEITVDAAPAFLVEQMEDYIYERGVDATIMRRGQAIISFGFRQPG